MKTVRYYLLGLALLASSVVCASQAQAQKQKDELRVLFIGNSLTYANDLPAIVEALAEASHQKHFVHQSVVFPDFSLEDRVAESYKLAADEVKGTLLPAAAAWREAWKLDNRLVLYSDDKFHPSVAGSYLAALVIYEKLVGATPVGLPSSLKLRSKALDKIELPKKLARLLQVAASEADKRF